MKTTHLAATLPASADAKKLKAEVSASITLQNQEPEKGNRDAGRSSRPTFGMSEPVPAGLLCALVAE